MVEEVNGNTMTVGDGPNHEDDFLNLGGGSKEIEFEVSENAGTYQDNNKDVLTLRVPYESLNEQILTFLRSKTDIRGQYDCGQTKRRISQSKMQLFITKYRSKFHVLTNH